MMGTPQQKWTAANRIWLSLCDGLMCAPDSHTDEYMHTRLQWQLDRMHALQTEARAEDPHVGRGVHIATINLPRR